MGISLQQWRGKIGTFSQTLKNSFILNLIILQQKGLSLAIRIALFYLLCAQCVEPNPGPPKVFQGTNTTKEDEPVEELNMAGLNESSLTKMRPIERVIYERVPGSTPQEELKLLKDEEYEEYDRFDGEAEEITPLPANPELMRKVSLKMSDIMGDIGVTQEMVNRRRRLFLMREKVNTDYSNIINLKNVKKFHFGSQSEGSTTLEMNSDIDMLVCDYDCPVELTIPDKDPLISFFLAIRTPEMPAQHCYLQMFCPYTRNPATVEHVIGRQEDVEIDDEGRVLLKHIYDDNRLKELWKGKYKKQGPSRSGWEDFDMVSALHCATLPEECQYLFTRMRPGHWPRKEVLEKAKGLGTFVVRQGHPNSPKSELEWRFSTSQIERLLMFDLNIVQLRTYIIVKLIRKSRFKEMVEDRLSTFHFKTAMLFTVEKYPPEIWRDENLTQCVINCLTTLQEFVRKRSCPHYTIEGVNLFAGKLNDSELQKIDNALSVIIEEPMKGFISIDMDNIEKRVLGSVFGVTKKDTVKETALCCFGQFCAMYKTVEGKEGFASKADGIHSLRLKQLPAEIMDTKSFIMSEKIPNRLFKEILKIQCCFLGSVRASFHIANKWAFPDDINIPYAVSLDADLTSCRLKFASMLYRSRQYTLAEQVLAHVESLLHPNVWQWCGCQGRPEIKPTNELVEMIRNLPDIGLIDKDGLPMIEVNEHVDIPELELFKANIARSVKFIKLESRCVPQHLVYEKDRTLCDEERLMRRPGDDWMDDIIIDAIPFLYYLQYLTYKELKDQEINRGLQKELNQRKQAALKKLHLYAFEKITGQGHAETAFNVLGHCYALENNKDMARQCYTSSLRLYRFNNAANIHMSGLGLSFEESFGQV
ncbi:uncharacterized protein LOC128207012 [Mya arenaria]|uniref:uncharacterized protein LOC128207012 n=1 Tax=Mya arenaria TaxID=6604 RepID=UPI0022E47E28|nr:uncharacterized protein LOC128207012 [Mya arenaria]